MSVLSKMQMKYSWCQKKVSNSFLPTKNLDFILALSKTETSVEGGMLKLVSPPKCENKIQSYHTLFELIFIGTVWMTFTL